MYYLLQTLPGLGDLAWREAEFLLPPGKDGRGPSTGGVRLVPGRNDIVLLRYDGDPRELLRLRVSEDVFALAARAFNVATDQRGLRQVYAALRNSQQVGDALAAWRRARAMKRPPATYRVVVRAVGGHSFLRRDLGKAVADAVADGWPGRWQRVDEDADVEVWATLIERDLLCGLRLSDVSMRRRAKRAHLPASLRPALAAAMVMLSEPAPADIFLDPMAGAGTLLVERAAAGPFAQIYGGDNNRAAVTAMETNTSDLRGAVECRRWDARALPLDEQSVNKVAVNLPFGKQVAENEDLPRLYRAVLGEIRRVIQPGGRVVILAGDMRLLDSARKAAAPTLRPLERHRVAVLGQPATIAVYGA